MVDPIDTRASFVLQEWEYNRAMASLPHSQHAPEDDRWTPPTDSMNWLAGVDDGHKQTPKGKQVR
jgi:hypothetical protein